MSNDLDDDKDSIIDYTEFDITSYMNSIDDESAKIIKDYFSEITRDLNQVFFYIPNNGKPKYLMQKFIDAILIFCPNAEFKIKQLDRTLNELNITWQYGEMNDAIYCYSDIEDESDDGTDEDGNDIVKSIETTPNVDNIYDHLMRILPKENVKNEP